MEPEAYWDAVVGSWGDTATQALLRAYSDAVNTALLDRWLPPRVGRVLKTDAFDEAVAGGVYPLLRRRAATPELVDVSPTTIAAARRQYPELVAQRADVRRLPFPDRSFDAVVSLSTLDHLRSRTEIAAAIRELRRILVPGGTLVITLDNPLNPLVALRNALPTRLLRRAGLVPYTTGATLGPRALRDELTGAGFSVTAEAATMHVPRVALVALARLRADAADTSVERLLRAESLAGRRTRYFTGQFVGARAVA